MVQAEPTGLAPQLGMAIHDDIIGVDMIPPSSIPNTDGMGARPKILRAF